MWSLGVVPGNEQRDRQGPLGVGAELIAIGALPLDRANEPLGPAVRPGVPDLRPGVLRAMTHLGVTDDDIDQAIEIIPEMLTATRTAAPRTR